MNKNFDTTPKNSNKVVYIFVACIFIGGPVCALLIVLLTEPVKPKQIIVKTEISTIKPTGVILRNANNQNLVSSNNPLPKANYIKDIITLDNITVDDNFNHILNITISNPYNKPISNIEIYVGYFGNVYIPDDISEDSPQLVKMEIKLEPNAHESYLIATNDKGVKDRDYVVSVRKVRLNDGTTKTP